jgi:hypothetical protein
MMVRRSLIVLALLSLLSSSVIADRKNPRNFPEGSFCPIHLGWQVDFSGIPIQDTTRIQQGLKFVAAGPRAVVSFLACDRNSALDDNLGEFESIGTTVDVRVDDVAVVREDVFLNHQKATIPDPVGCYFSGAHPFPDIAVGSVFDASMRVKATPFTARMPFFDDFSKAAVTERLWRFGGAELDTNQGSLVLARTSDQRAELRCSTASFRVQYLLKGKTYVDDFKWSVSGGSNGIDDGEPMLLTFFDLNPGA